MKFVMASLFALSLVTTVSAQTGHDTHTGASMTKPAEASKVPTPVKSNVDCSKMAGSAQAECIKATTPKKETVK